MKHLIFGCVAALIVAGCATSKNPPSTQSQTAATTPTAIAATNSVAAISTPAPVAASAAVPAAPPAPDVAVIKTSAGDMVIEFWPDAAPRTVENFKKLAGSGFYDGTLFHRVIKGFMIQGGDPLTKDATQEMRWGSGGPGYSLKAEFNDHSHVRGVISMARSSDPDSAGSQFFICDGSPTQLDHQYTAFGQLIKGEDVLDKIANAPTHPPDRPNTPQVIESIKIVPGNTIK